MIGHNYFNKSLTLDIENKLMQYLSSVDSVENLYNKRTNPQSEYYTSEHFEAIFSKIWQQLHRQNAQLFPLESAIQESAIFKASPFHKLTNEQYLAKQLILERVRRALQNDETGQHVFVDGEAGSGKTVLLSSLFFELVNEFKKDFKIDNPSLYFLVNHNQQLKVYQQIADKLGFNYKSGDKITKPTSFINNHSLDEKVDVVVIDEAHLLLTQGQMSYRGKNHLADIISRAKVVVTVFDKNQILSRTQIWEEDTLQQIIETSQQNDNYIKLLNQMRIHADKQTIHWIRNLVDNRTIDNIPKDSLGYEIKVFESPKSLYEEIKAKNENKDSGISRVVATFDWEFKDKPKSNGELWSVEIDDWKLPWNLQLSVDRLEKKLSWPEQSQTINEVGSTFTIQGFDLNYVGVIIGPSVIYREGKIQFDKNKSKNNKATQNRTMADNSKQNFAEELLKNELNVLITRGINGLYLYAVDEELQNALLRASKGEIIID
ncbi:DNA/RNA helicase domain-containing protein [Staphylococcus chromogenes]|uniref:DNA/RNA helicase domain-containing protein n=1 Tax=Staphylococcus chromogenes TaxID=46126 RepID=UPI001F5407B8|nr:DNA/RNA helicase domain-containing protein [Staphylococcus chromogenes]